MDFGSFAPYLAVAEIILAVVLIVLVLLQAKGSDLGFMGGSDSSGYRTRRGIEVTLYRATIGFSIAFFVCTLLTFIAFGQSV